MLTISRLRRSTAGTRRATWNMPTSDFSIAVIWPMGRRLGKLPPNPEVSTTSPTVTGLSWGCTS